MSEIIEIINNRTSKEPVESKEIPDLDLYMDQVLTLLNDKVDINEDKKAFTKTMINNYSKAKVITKVKGKKYKKHQLIQLLLINELKSTLSISQIQELLTPYYEQEQDIISVYDEYITYKKSLDTKFYEVISNLVTDNNLTIENDRDKLLTILILTNINNNIDSLLDEFLNKQP